MGIGRRAWRVGRIFTAQAMNVEKFFGPLVIGLKIAIAEGPGRRNAVVVLYLLKVPLAQTEMGRSIHFGSSTHEVVAPWLKGLALAIEPSVLRDVAIFLKHLSGIPVLRLPR
ncbi:MAG: hypothetical protein JW384_04090 [Nitrosomonadaceae bacterium]|nr:hypothetical protein [Nitrosomonadaceae bacterium]